MESITFSTTYENLYESIPESATFIVQSFAFNLEENQLLLFVVNINKQHQLLLMIWYS